MTNVLSENNVTINNNIKMASRQNDMAHPFFL